MNWIEDLAAEARKSDEQVRADASVEDRRAKILDANALGRFCTVREAADAARTTYNSAAVPRRISVGYPPGEVSFVMTCGGRSVTVRLLQEQQALAVGLPEHAYSLRMHVNETTDAIDLVHADGSLVTPERLAQELITSVVRR